ncbi:hypothetical protein NPIL_411561 [Nephila pilipes]|uniref:Uncharacterized protein n=1 Tax=Nephila pilipes TaxID=299642 RepID=A0A8X6MG82_NEPPI|nr:hypothetical protein NPIL_411561 [Nephila pilipes]
MTEDTSIPPPVSMPQISRDSRVNQSENASSGHVIVLAIMLRSSRALMVSKPLPELVESRRRSVRNHVMPEQNTGVVHLGENERIQKRREIYRSSRKKTPRFWSAACRSEQIGKYG